MFDLPAIQSALRDLGLDGWLLYDFRGSNELTCRVLGLAKGTRRVACCIPADGPPRKLVHRIEAGALDHLPGEKTVYLRWQEFEAGVQHLLGGMKTVAMEYAPRNAIPPIARVDAGTVELVRSFGVEVVSSGDLIQLFEATLDDEQRALHLEAAVHTNSAYDVVWRFIADRVRGGGSVTEVEVRDRILAHFAEHGLVTDHGPIVAVGPHSGDPHYETGTGTNTTIQAGDFVLVDLWGKLDRPRAIYSDLTRVGYVGETVPDSYESIFRIVASARDAAIATVETAFAVNHPLQGWQVDQAARDVIDEAGYGQNFVHRTGHSIGQETHGNGANIDNLETHETRRILRRTCFSIEPGIYLPEFGIRSEVDVLIEADGTVNVTGGERQQSVVAILHAG